MKHVLITSLLLMTAACGSKEAIPEPRMCPLSVRALPAAVINGQFVNPVTNAITVAANTNITFQVSYDYTNHTTVQCGSGDIFWKFPDNSTVHNTCTSYSFSEKGLKLVVLGFEPGKYDLECGNYQAPITLNINVQ